MVLCNVTEKPLESNGPFSTVLATTKGATVNGQLCDGPRSNGHHDGHDGVTAAATARQPGSSSLHPAGR
eukprot:gene11581-biopygen7867